MSKDQEEVANIFLQDIQVLINQKIEDLKEKIDKSELELLELRQLVEAGEFDQKSKRDTTIRTQDLEKSDSRATPRKDTEPPTIVLPKSEQPRVDVGNFDPQKPEAIKQKSSLISQLTMMRKLSSAAVQEEGGPSRSFTITKMQN